MQLKCTANAKINNYQNSTATNYDTEIYLPRALVMLYNTTNYHREFVTLQYL